MDMPAAFPCAQNNQLTLSIKLPNCFEVAEIDVSDTIDHYSASGVRIDRGCGKYAQPHQHKYHECKTTFHRLDLNSRPGTRRFGYVGGTSWIVFPIST